MAKTMIIRDPLHGNIEIDKFEQRIVDHPYFQRLRFIKQLGFTELAFPGASHSRYGHSLGTMFIATKIFDKLKLSFNIPEEKIHLWRRLVRIASLLHDVGHAPLSHATEKAMPDLGKLKLDEIYGKSEDPKRQASHEDYTIKIICDSSLTPIIDEQLHPIPSGSRLVAHLIHQKAKIKEDSFYHEGVDYRPCLKQIISGELDADRMDYLYRDSFYTGVNYGKYDMDWLIHSLESVIIDNRCYTCLSKRGVLSYEDYLLSRYSMFLSVYLHYTTCCFEKMLIGAISESEYKIPHEIEEYLFHDDIHILSKIRGCNKHFSKMINDRKAYRLVFDGEAEEGEADYNRVLASIREKNFKDLIHTPQVKIIPKPEKSFLYVKLKEDHVVKMSDYSKFYAQYAEPLKLYRIYIEPETYKTNKSRIKEIIKG